jgi:hypothetical protein
MSRILKRPMFRKGGSANSGIMHGLVDRKGYAAAGPIDKELVRSNITNIRDLLTEFSPQPKDTSMYEMLIGGGLETVSGKHAGQGLLANLAGSYKGPSEKFFERQRDIRDYDRKIGSTAAQIGVEQALTLQQLREKDNPQSALYNVYLKQAIDDGYDGPKAERYAAYQAGMKRDLENKVGANSISDTIIDFNVNDLSTKGNKKKKANLKKHVGKYVYDVFEGNIKLITIVDGQVGWIPYNSVADIDLADRNISQEEEKVLSKYDAPDYSDIGIGQQMLTP